MNVTEYLLTVAAEECNEIGQRCTKAARFGLEQIQEKKDDAPDQNPLRRTNRERIVYELNDLLTTLDLLGVIQIDHEGTITVDAAMQGEKQRKLERYMRFARELGTLADVTKLGEVDCYTPACGWDGEKMGQAEVFQIGRQLRVICQRCLSCHALSPDDRKRFKESIR